jgi:hypothetical protein
MSLHSFCNLLGIRDRLSSSKAQKRLSFHRKNGYFRAFIRKPPSMMMPLTFWRLFLLLAVSLWVATPTAYGEAIVQLFNLSWNEVAAKIPEIAEAGYTSLWLPPPTKGGGGYSVGYDLWDPFDLGASLEGAIDQYSDPTTGRRSCVMSPEYFSCLTRRMLYK